MVATFIFVQLMHTQLSQQVLFSRYFDTLLFVRLKGFAHGQSHPSAFSNNNTEHFHPASKPLVPPGSTIKAFASARDTALDLSKPTGIACNAPSTIVTFALTKRVNGFGFGKSFAK